MFFGIENLLMMPRIRDAILSTNLGSDGCFDRIRTAVLSRTVDIAFRPAARIVSPDSLKFWLAILYAAIHTSW